jgi:hypothetical protein
MKRSTKQSDCGFPPPVRRRGLFGPSKILSRRRPAGLPGYSAIDPLSREEAHLMHTGV